MLGLYDQIQVYINMDDEISFEEFNDFYRRLLDELGSDHESYDEELVWKNLFVIENVMSNAESRSGERKNADSKKYKKMAQRLQLWSKNLTNRLNKIGYSEEDITERFDKMFEEDAPSKQ